MVKLKCLAIALLLMMAMGVKAEDGVMLLMKDGTQVGFAFSEKPKMVTNETALTMVTAKGTSVSYAYDKVQRAFFSDEVATAGIKSPNVSSGKDVTFRITDDAIEVEGLASGSTVSLYTTDGRCVAKAKPGKGSTILSVSRGKQVYIVKTSTGISYKFMKH